MLRVEDEHHAIAAAKENMTPVLAGMFAQTNDVDIEAFGGVQIRRVQAAFQNTRRLHGKSLAKARRRKE
jgi:hypothetical protein